MFVHKISNKNIDTEIWLRVVTINATIIGYIRLDEYEIKPTLWDIRIKIHPFLKDYIEYQQGWYFGTIYPTYNVIEITKEPYFFAFSFLPEIVIFDSNTGGDYLFQKSIKFLCNNS